MPRSPWNFATAIVHAVLDADGIIDRIGADYIHGNVHRAVEAQLADADR